MTVRVVVPSEVGCGRMSESMTRKKLRFEVNIAIEIECQPVPVHRTSFFLVNLLVLLVKQHITRTAGMQMEQPYHAKGPLTHLDHPSGLFGYVFASCT